MRTVSEILAELATTGLDPRQLTLVVEAIASYDVVRQSYDSRTTPAQDRKREYDKNYQKNRRLARKQTMSGQVEKPPDSRTRNGNGTVNLSFFGEEERKKDACKKEGSKRGTRLGTGESYRARAREFALAEGGGDAEFEKLWIGFVDYWAGIPGQRGTKLDWLATFRNRWRDVMAKRKPTGMLWRSGIEGVV